MKHLRSGKSVSSPLPLFYFLVLALKRTKNVTIFLIMAFEVDSPHLPLCWLPGWAAVWIRSENSSLSLAPPWTKHATNYECTFSPLKHKQGQAIFQSMQFKSKACHLWVRPRFRFLLPPSHAVGDPREGWEWVLPFPDLPHHLVRVKMRWGW